MKKIQYIFLLLAVSAMSLMAENGKQTSTDGVGGKVTATLVDGVTYSIEAVAEDGYEFLYWLENNSTTNPFNHILTETEGTNTTFTAVFGKTAQIKPDHGSVKVVTSNAGTKTFTLTAQPASCAAFRWSDNTAEVSQTYTEGDEDIYPIFKTGELADEIATPAIEAGSVTVTKDECSVTLTAIPNEGYVFKVWEDGSTTNPRVIEYSVSFKETYGATFALDQAVASIATTKFNTIADAIAAANKEDEIKILADVEEDIIINKPIRMNGNNKTIGNISLGLMGDLNLTGNLTAKDLVITSTKGKSSQIHNVAALTFANAYYDLQLEPEKAIADPNKYYAFAVPFETSVESLRRQSAPNSILKSMVDMLIWEYDGTLRASSKENGWVKKEEGALLPGKFYMIGIDGNENVWRFAKTGDFGSTTAMVLPEYNSGDIYNCGWNAVANPLLTYANAAVSDIDYAQVYDNTSASGAYNVIPFAGNTFVVACPFFVQVGAQKTLILTEPQTLGTLRAPKTEDDVLRCCITLADGTRSDALYLTARETATEGYEIGKDLVKIMGGNQDAYVWANGYGQALCAMDVPSAMEINYPISFFAPKEGKYTLSASVNDEVEIYLTYSNMVIATLAADYELDLQAGTNSNYGIRIYTAHKTPTSLNSQKATNEVTKYIHNNALYIRANGYLYTILGNKVK
ncbi:MAG: hypothetical protein MJZ64_07960 [Paludibacteraceae bacterium]|nr:hypothetical protein [Paludibacteraceae bacterium]